MTAVIRPVTVADLDLVVAFQTTTWREAYAGLVPQAYLDDPSVHERRRRRWHARLAGGDLSSGRHSRLAVEGNDVVGVASWGPSRDDPPEPATELMSLYVRRSHYGTGVADRLLQAALGDGDASLWVFEQNARARSFYRRHRFDADGRRAVDPGTGVEEIRLVRRGRSALQELERLDVAT